MPSPGLLRSRAEPAEPAPGPRTLPPPPPLPACPPVPSQSARLGGGAQAAPCPYQLAGRLSARPPLPRRCSPGAAAGCLAQLWLPGAGRLAGIRDPEGALSSGARGAHGWAAVERTPGARQAPCSPACSRRRCGCCCCCLPARRTQ